jgi:uncharacterized protein involved in outer membrane biogenesis
MKTIRSLLLVASLVLIVSLGGLVAFLATLDPNAYKAEIERAFTHYTGRQLVLEGPLELAWWPRVRLRVGVLSLANAKGFEPPNMMEVRDLEIAVPTLSLLRGRIAMDTAKIHGLTLHLTRNAQGQSNWQDLLQDPQKAPPAEAGTLAAFALGGVALGGVDIAQATLRWEDVQAGRDLVFDAAQAKTGPLAFNTPVDFRLQAQVRSSLPALAGETVLAGTVTFHPRQQRYLIAPLDIGVTLQGKGLPGGKSTLSLQMNSDLNFSAGNAQFTAIKGQGLGVTFAGALALDQLNSPHPGGRGEITLQAPDLGVVFKAFDLPGAARLATMKNRGLALHTQLAVDGEQGEIHCPQFTAQLPGSEVSGELNATGLHTQQPIIQARLAAHSSQVSDLLLIAHQWAGGDVRAARVLGKALAGTTAHDFQLAAEIDVDLTAGRVRVPTLHATLFGNTLTGNVTPTGGQPGAPAFSATLAAGGPNLPVLLLAAELLRGTPSESLEARMAALQASGDPSYLASAELLADFGADRLALTRLSGKLLGNQAEFSLNARNLRSGSPAVTGTLQAAGPDLAALLALSNRLPDLRALIDTLPEPSAKAYTFSARFNADTHQEQAQLSALTASFLGLNLAGDLAVQQFTHRDRTVAGHLRLVSLAPKALLAASGYPMLVAGLKEFSAETDFKATGAELNLAPFDAQGDWQMPGQLAPLRVTLHTDTAKVNLDRATAWVKVLTLNAPGLALTASLDAEQLRTAPAWSGQINLPPFDLRALLAQLDHPLPALGEAQTYTRVGVEAVFKGTPNSLTLEQLRARIDDTSLSGTINISDFQRPELGFNLQLDQLNLDRYLAPRQDTGKARPVTPATLPLAVATLPVTALQALGLEGELGIDTFQLAGAQLSQVKITTRARAGLLEINPATADLYQGKYSGVARLNLQGPQPELSVNTTLAKVAIEPLINDLGGTRQIGGNLNVEARLTASGHSPEALFKTLGGQATFALQKGRVRGVDLPAILQTAQALIKRRATALPTGGETRFKALTGTLEIRDGAVFNPDLRMDGEGFKLTGEGLLVKLKDTTTHYDASLTRLPNREPASSPPVALGTITMPIRCRGVISATSCKLDLKNSTGLKKSGQKLGASAQESVGGKASTALKKQQKF